MKFENIKIFCYYSATIQIDENCAKNYDIIRQSSSVTLQTLDQWSSIYPYRRQIFQKKGFGEFWKEVSVYRTSLGYELVSFKTAKVEKIAVAFLNP